MTADDLQRIEDALGIRLPDSYRSRMQGYPIPAAAGNTDLEVWDHADRLIELNRELRGGLPGGVAPWPPRFFALGRGGDGCSYALDLDATDAVWWVDRGHLDNPVSQREAASFSAWADEYFETLRQEMAGEEVDPDGTPTERARVESKNARSMSVSCLVALVLLAGMAAAVAWLVRSWLR
jgi:SMI1/KNR4 family protein SUKH-1